MGVAKERVKETYTGKVAWVVAGTGEAGEILHTTANSNIIR